MYIADSTKSDGSSEGFSDFPCCCDEHLRSENETSYVLKDNQNIQCVIRRMKREADDMNSCENNRDTKRIKSSSDVNFVVYQDDILVV